jgi:hypothetical protein
MWTSANKGPQQSSAAAGAAVAASKGPVAASKGLGNKVAAAHKNLQQQQHTKNLQ